VIDETMTAPLIGPDRATWLPQRFGMKRTGEIDDPLVEPAWNGIRILVRFGDDAAAASADDGEELELPPNLEVAIVDAVRAGELVLDGYLSGQPGRSTEGMAVGRVEGPSAGEIARQLFIGTRRSDAASIPRVIDIGPGDTLAFVAVDLLSIDHQPLLDVPLLERKRLLESAIAESELVRRSVYVRPPVERWLMSWRAMGFSHVAFKASNGRYTPGQENESWTMWKIPAR
jgi:hypothetical protein